MSAATPGQAAYEAYVMAAPDDLNFREPDKLADWEYPAWDAAAQAGYEQRAAQEPHAAPELAAAMRESRVRAEVITEILDAFSPSGSGHTARVGMVQIAKWRTRAGLTS